MTTTILVSMMKLLFFKQKKIILPFTALIFLSSAVPSRLGFSETLPPLPAGPLILTSVTQDQLNPDYWISRLPEPDKVLMTSEQLKAFNEHIHFMMGDCVDVFKMDLTKAGKHVSDQIKREYQATKNRRLYTVTNDIIQPAFFEEEILPQLEWDKIPQKIKLRWGVAVRQASVRALPSAVKMLEKPNDIEFDMLQFTQIKLWTPVGIYHSSKDGKWFYVQAPYTRGWVKASDIALFDSREVMKKYAKSSQFLTVTGESIPLFERSDFKTVLQSPSMGTILPLAEKSTNTYQTFVPVRGPEGKYKLAKAYVNAKTDVTIGFPAYTQRNIIRQAFKLLGARYGWGGTYNGRDCSGFTHDVFLSMGIEMPRNSKDQGYVGNKVGFFEPFKSGEDKTYFLKHAIPGVTLLRMPMHLMIFVGEVDGKFYVIHSTWAERISKDSDQKNRINQVVVSDLSLNGRSYLGSLFDRLISINEVLWS